MKYSLLIVWLLVPVGVVAYHFGPGQSQLPLDRSGEHLRDAAGAAQDMNWLKVASRYAMAREALPENDARRRQRLTLAEAQARIRGGQMIEGQEQLHELLEEMKADSDSSAALEISTRSELAMASYHAAWLMRLELATSEEWLPEAERARQQYRWLTEKSAELAISGIEERGPAAHRQKRLFSKNLEATIKLQQMDLEELKAKPLPKNCPNGCCNLSQRKRKQCESRAKNRSGGKKKSGKKKQPQDARKQIKKSNSAGLNDGNGEGS